MADEVNLNISAEPVADSTPVEEVPGWASQLSSEIRESNSLQRETLEVLRNQSNLLPQVMETNATLTSQLQRVPGEIIDLVRPLLTPPPLVVTPPTDIQPVVDVETVPLEVDEEPEVIPAVESPRKRRRAI